MCLSSAVRAGGFVLVVAVLLFADPVVGCQSAVEIVSTAARESNPMRGKIDSKRRDSTI